MTLEPSFSARRVAGITPWLAMLLLSCVADGATAPAPPEGLHSGGGGLHGLRWSEAGPIPGMVCVRIHEDADPHAWHDNFLCGPEDFGLTWSQAGPIDGMRCVHVEEPADPHTWGDNYLCGPRDYGMRWSYAGPIGGMECVAFREPSDPHTWIDNFLCHRPPEPTRPDPPPSGGGSLSRSKLGFHVKGGNDDAVRTVLEECPRVMKWLVGEGTDAIHDYRTRCPGGTVVLRVYVPWGHACPAGGGGREPCTTAHDPVTAADHFWGMMARKLADHGITPDRVDWLEGPNELDGLPNWYRDVGAARWFASYWSRLADQMNVAGYDPMVGSIAVGNPADEGELYAGSPNPMCFLADVMRSKPYRIGWSYHGYTPDLSREVSREQWHSLRYRRIADQCGLHGFPLVLTEGGQDAGGLGRGWRALGTTPDAYMEWLRWYDERIREDGDVVGATLFQMGQRSGDWVTFDLHDLAGDLAAHLDAAGRSDPDPPPPPPGGGPGCDPPHTVERDGRCVPSCGRAGGDTCGGPGDTLCDGYRLLEAYDCAVCCNRSSPPPPPPGDGCGCSCDVPTHPGDPNFCHHPPGTAGCPMTDPGGYCDPNGNGDFSDDGNWMRGWEEYDRCCR